MPREKKGTDILIWYTGSEKGIYEIKELSSKMVIYQNKKMLESYLTPEKEKVNPLNSKELIEIKKAGQFYFGIKNPLN